MAATDYSTSTTGAPSWALPYANDYLQRSSQVANTPYQQSPTQVSAPNQYQLSGWQAMANRATQGSPVQSAASGQLSKTINGGYLGANPYLNQMVDQVHGDMTRNYNNVTKPQTESAMVRSGSFGHSGLDEYQREQERGLLGAMGDASTRIRSQDYANERGYQNAAIQSAPGFAANDYIDADALMRAGGQVQGYENQQRQQDMNWWSEAQRYPQQRLDSYGNALSNVMGTNRTSTTASPGTSTAAGIAGGALAGWQLYQSMFGK